jgi:ABC-2 type transport system permease protein
MTKLWRVAAYEYRRNVFKRSFLLTLLSVPFMMAVSIGMGFLLETLPDNDQPLGYVDEAGVLAQAIPAPTVSSFDDPVELIAFATEAEARAALEAGALQAYYVLPRHYSATRQLRLVYGREPGDNARRQFYDFLQINLLADWPPEIAYRAAAGTQVTVRSLDGRRAVPAGGPTFGLLMPLFITIAFLALILLSSGYLLSALADEKDNRTIEILATSVSPLQLAGGKVLGIVAISLTLAAAWAAVAALGVGGAAGTGIGWFQDLRLQWNNVLAPLVIALPAYVLAAALMMALGASVTASQEAQALSMLFVGLHIVPAYMGLAFLSQPHGPAAVALSLLPFTALMTVAMRSLFAVVPAWQVAASAGVQALCALGAVWLAARAYRRGLLRTGQRLGWRGLFAAGG